MSAPVNYTLHHAKWYRRRVSVWWWLKQRAYTLFVIRELTSLAVAYFSIIFLWKLSAIACCADAYAAFLEQMKHPVFIVLNTIALILILFHSFTWFNLAPKAMVVRFGGKRLPDRLIQATNYLAWIGATAVVIWLSQRG